MPNPTHKLATIVFTDIVGFTKLSAENEPLAIQLLETQRTTLKPIVERHNGNWLKEIGDGLLLTFDTTKDAVDCSIEMQHTVKNVANLDLRIGIHQGEVVIQGNDVLGDDVNVASRIEPFASPGGIVVTNRVNASLLRDPVYQTKLVGKPALKGVRQEVKLHCIISHGLPETDISQVSAKLEPDSSPSATATMVQAPAGQEKKEKKGPLPLIIGGAAGVVILAGIVMFFMKGSDNSKQVSIACLPFVNMSADKENEYFSDGITEEILNYLAKIKNLRVISRTSVFTYKDKKDINLAEIGRQLDVSHVLEGSVRKAGQKVRITAQLIRSNDDAHLWSETYDRELKDIFAVQDEIAQTIVNTLKIDYIGHTGDKEPKKSETSVEAYNMYLQGMHFQDRRDEEGMRKALSFFKNTIHEDPNYELAYVGLANTYLLLADYGYASFDENIPLAEYNASKAMELNPESAEVHSANAYVSLLKKNDPKKTESFYLKAIELNPNYATAHHWYSDFLRMVVKDYKKALSYAKAAQKLDPLSGIIAINLAQIQIYLNKKDDAGKTLKNILEVHPKFLQAYLVLSRIYQSQGLWEKSEKITRKVIEIKPDDGRSWQSLAETLTAQGKTKEGIGAYKKFVDLNPSSSMALEHLSVGYYFDRNYKKSLETIEKIYGLTPFAPLANMIEGWILFQKKDYKAALDVLSESKKGFLGLSALHEALALSGQGIVYAEQGDTEKALSIINELTKFGGADGIESLKGIIHLYLGNTKQGFDIINNGILNQNPYLYIKVDPRLDQYRDRPRFKELLKLYNLG